MTAYLEYHRPARKQWSSRSLPDRSIIVLHTAEGSFNGSLAWILTRTTPGSYHRLFDPTESVQLIDYRHAAYGARGWNARVVHLSGALKAGDWPELSPPSKQEWVKAFAQNMAHAAHWFASVGLPMPVPRLLTVEEAKRPGASGIISHARLDPTRRADPGEAFPWNEVLGRYAELIGQPAEPTPPSKEKDMTSFNVADLQTLYNGFRATLDLLGVEHEAPPRLTVDGDWGPKTAAAVGFMKGYNLPQAAKAAMKARGPEVVDPDGDKWRELQVLARRFNGLFGELVDS